eukprot:TRINITY_DN11096_c0_g2_i1.p1 TRINITY_DN11096_c0_g2~~TRINITY_DN11096_c0_g2_i1.p1  ORF type:complete len:603 (+),score=96.32 TRINITY_DN11096_c0_g2_i1:34-1842(+)
MGRRKSTRETVKYTSELVELEGVEYYRAAAKLLLWSPKVEAVINVVIVLNAITIGIDQTLELETGSQSPVIVVLDQTFLVVYILELFLRFFGVGVCASLGDRWVWLDMVLVGTGVLSDWVLKPLMGAEQLRVLMVLRSLRLLRLVKALKLMMKFRELCLLTQGLLASAGTMVYVLLLLFVILYCFAAMAMELVTKHRLASGIDENEVFAGIVATYFSSLPVTMLTLLQFATLDSVGAIYKPLIESDWFLAVYFIGVILVVSIVLMNLVAAIIINTALEQAMQDKALQQQDEATRRKKMLKDLNEMFHRVDDDGSGELSKEELTMASSEDKAFIFSCTDVEDPLEFFDMIDVDRTGAVDIDEFCDGVWQAVVSKAPIEVRRMERVLKSMRRDLRVLDKHQRDVRNMLQQLCMASGGSGGMFKTESETTEKSSPPNSDGESPMHSSISWNIFPPTPRAVSAPASNLFCLPRDAGDDRDEIGTCLSFTNPPRPDVDVQSFQDQIHRLNLLVTDIHRSLVMDPDQALVVQRPASKIRCEPEVQLNGQPPVEATCTMVQASIGEANRGGRTHCSDDLSRNAHTLHAEFGTPADFIEKEHIAEHSVLV